MAEPPMDKLYIRSWPKMLFLWPTAALSLVLCILATVHPVRPNVWGGLFLAGLFLNLIVLTFEFPRATSFTMVVVVALLVVGLVSLNHRYGFVVPLKHWLAGLEINATPHFYLALCLMYVVLLLGMLAVTRFDYWELSANELVHHHGVLGDVERFSTAGLKLNKEIHDVFEYLIAGAGRIVMVIPSQARPVILENVLRISRVERASDKILDARVVRVAGGQRSETASHEEDDGG